MASTEAAKRYRTVVGWNYKSKRSEPGNAVPRDLPEKVVKTLLREGAIEEVKD